MESQGVSPLQADDNKAHINRRAQRHSKHKTGQKHKISTKEVRSADLIQNSPFLEIPFMSTILSNSLLPSQGQYFVRHDLGLNCLQELSTDKELKAKR